MKHIPKVILRIETSRACGRGILRGIAKYCRLCNVWRLSQKPPFYLIDGESEELSWPENWVADGMIISQPEVPETIMKIGVPIIGIDVREKIPNMPNIIGDADSIAQMAASHFFERGFRNFAYCGFEDIDWSIERGLKFDEIVTEAGFHCHRYRQTEKKRRSWDDELFFVAEWLSSLPKPLAVFSCNDDLCWKVNQACQSADIKVPDDVALLGVDNDEMICLPSDPPLSSIALNFERAGFEAAQLLNKLIFRMEKSKSQKIVLQPTHIVIRQSTDTLAISDSDVSSAIRFIREHFNEPITVLDVVNSTTISRRSLENRFRQYLGLSINAEIRRVRIDHVAMMLTETNLTISQIAADIQYTDVEHLARYFRQEKGISPLEYRKRIGPI